ncbi:hypothetical protein JCM11641_000802 [Rhodosporidiobolus odoratus]
MAAPPPPPPGFPAAAGAFVLPIPPPWTEHKAPGGQPYWFNPITNVSTYTRPGPPPPPGFPNGLPPPPPGFPIAGMPPPPAGFPIASIPAPFAPAQLPPLHFTATGELKQGAAAGEKKKEKKEKPKEKLPIERSVWIRVTTNKGNVFFSNKETKESVWTVPEEIKEQVEEIEKKEREEREEKEREEREEREKVEAEEAAAAGGKKRKAEENQGEAEESLPAEDDQHKSTLDLEIEGTNGTSSSALPEKPASPPPQADEPPKKKKQKKRVVTSLEELEAGDLESKEPVNKVKKEEFGAGEEESEEDWQRQIAEQMAMEAAEAEGGKPAVEEVKPTEVKVDVPDMDQVEAGALYKILLGERDINPMAPFEQELPKFVADPRYHAVKTNRDRRDIFDEFCKEKLREQRAAKKKNVEQGKKVDPLVAFRTLLSTFVTSTRTHFSDFKRSHQRDARYREFGKTEGDREKEFKKFLRELGEEKRKKAEIVERDFREMLREDGEIRQGDKWSEVKKRHANDPRYVAVNSSSLREQLFGKHLSSLASGSRPPPPSASAASSTKPQPTKEDKAARAAASLKEREEKVRMDKMKQDRDAQRARGNLGKEEAEREFGQLLVDAVRDHKARFEDLVPTLSRDPRFDAPSLYPPDKRRLFDQHQQKLYRTRLSDVESLFAQHSPKLTTPFHSVLPSISSDPHVTRLVSQDFDSLERLYDSWLNKRTQKARQDFTQMLKENAVVEHWGRLKKLEKREEVKLIEEEGKRNDESDEEEMGVREMAEQVDMKAIHAVLKQDKRYLEIDHMPEERHRWLEEYVEGLSAPKTTMHQRD